MTTEQALGEFLLASGVIDRSGPPKNWYSGNWFFTHILGIRIPIFPRLGFRAGLPAHDTHHMLTGYRTDWVGECEVAAWELASGGCGRHLAYWIDRVLFCLVALFTAPHRTLHAFRRGWGKRNLYRVDPGRLLATEVEDVRRYISG